MDKISFKPTWNPRKRSRRAPNAPGISDKTWNRHRDLIEDLYMQHAMKLEDLMNHMRLRYDFSPSIRQYTKKLRDWGCRKYKPFLAEGSHFQSTLTPQSSSSTKAVPSATLSDGCTGPSEMASVDTSANNTGSIINSGLIWHEPPLYSLDDEEEVATLHDTRDRRSSPAVDGEIMHPPESTSTARTAVKSSVVSAQHDSEDVTRSWSPRTAQPVLIDLTQEDESSSTTARPILTSSGRSNDALSISDICGIETLAGVFEAAHLYEDAYELYRLVFCYGDELYLTPDTSKQEIIHYRKLLQLANAATTVANLQVVVNTMQTAKDLITSGHRSDTFGLLKALFEAILDHAKGLENGAEYTKTLTRYSELEDVALDAEERPFCARTILITNLFVLPNAPTILERTLRSACLGRVYQFFEPDGHGHQLLIWCTSKLNSYGLADMVARWSIDIWSLPLSQSNLSDAEGTLLFLYLWREKQRPLSDVPTRTQIFDKPKFFYCKSCGSVCGEMSETNILALLARIIMNLSYRTGKPESSQSSFPDRALANAGALLQTSCFQVTDQFLGAYSALLKTKVRNGRRGAYVEKIESLARNFIDEILRPQLSEFAMRMMADLR